MRNDIILHGGTKYLELRKTKYPRICHCMKYLYCIKSKETRSRYPRSYKVINEFLLFAP
jgi:hypothetical protein